MADIKSWKHEDPKQPKFPDDFKVVKKAVLQVTDLVTNRNKYYAIEIHEAKSQYRVFTHYGRTDDLDTNPNAGCRESRYCDSLAHAEGVYQGIYSQKTSARKGYKEINLASSKIGSSKSIGQSSGAIDAKTLAKMNEKTKGKVVVQKSTMLPGVSPLVEFLYKEAVNALTTTVNATITANGIETPLGVLTLAQIEKGEEILVRLEHEIAKKKPLNIMALTSEFYTSIPHRIGRAREAAQASVIDTANKIAAKVDTLQLMRDMLNVNGDENVLLDPEIEKKYKALNCTIACVDPKSDLYKQTKDYVEKSQVRAYTGIKVKNIWEIARPDETKIYSGEKVGNEKLLFHGSASRNWVGILSRGILLPKTVVKLGVRRTDAGWLGSGIYFGNAICTSYGYAGQSSRRTAFIACANVALGKVKQYRKITYGLDAPPDGFDSCHGVRGSEFSDDEFVVYKQDQQKLTYLVECGS